jgi:hypothetical protein
MSENQAIADDLIEGAAAIAVFLWGDASKKRRVYHCADTGQLPIFRIGEILHARRSTLREFIERREREAISNGKAA